LIIQSNVRPNYVVIPKVESAEIVQLVDALLCDAGKPTSLVALIEMPAGVASVDNIARSTPHLAALLWQSGEPGGGSLTGSPENPARA
jgi:(S)-citramalyl-CoA lyase